MAEFIRTVEIGPFCGYSHFVFPLCQLSSVIEILRADQFHFRRLVKREPRGLLSVDRTLDLK